MIIFTSNPQIISQVKDPIVFNLSSYYSGYNDISNLVRAASSVVQNRPVAMEGMFAQGIGGSELIDYISSPDFDIRFANLLTSDDHLFISIMKIMINSYEGKNVVILVHHDEFRDCVAESIIKFIQVRYGYNCWIAEALEDLSCLRQDFFTPTGIMSLDEDRKRYMKLHVSGVAEYIGDMRTKDNMIYH